MNNAANQAAFQEARSLAQAAHGNALRLAQEAFDAQHAAIKEKHARHYEHTRDNFDQRKFDPDDRQHDHSKRDFDEAKSRPANYKPAHDQREKATRAADQTFHEAMNRLALQFGIGARQEVRN